MKMIKRGEKRKLTDKNQAISRGIREQAKELES
jgi:hypothetical protein